MANQVHVSWASRLDGKPRVSLGVILSIILLALPAQAQNSQDHLWEFNIDIGVEARMFPDSPQFDDQDDQRIQPSIFFEPDWFWESESGDDQVVIKPFVRFDAIDTTRSHVDIREAYWSRRLGDGSWEWSLGINKVYWGVVESRHLVDIINQVDALEDIDEEDKLGQPMLKLTHLADWGTVDLLLMTGFREREFPGRDGRLRIVPFPIDVDNPIYESDLEEWQPEIALRYSHYFGPVDLGLHLFHGTSREPRLRLSSTLYSTLSSTLSSNGRERFIPHYDKMSQIGLDLQYTAEATLWKGEAILREGAGDPFGAASVGVEHTLYQIGGSGADLGLLAEVHLDDRDPLSDPASLYDEDLFVGARFTLNDAQDTSLLAGALRDIDSDETLWTVEGQRRFGDNWVGELECRGFSDVSPGLSLLEKDSFLNVRLTRFF